MNIAIAGKGGSGKTTIAGLLARSLGRTRGDVLAVDGDSNPNLALTLGIGRPLDDLPCVSSEVLESYTDEQGRNRVRLAWPPQKVVDRFAVLGPDSVRLLVVSRVGHAGSG